MASRARFARLRIVNLLVVLTTSIAACEPTTPPKGVDVESSRAGEPGRASPRRWKRPQPRRQFYPSTIAFWDERRGLLAGTLSTARCRNRGTCQDVVQLTADGGETWRIIKRGSERFVSLATFGESRAWLTVKGCRKLDLCSRGLWESRDGGTSWKRTTTRHMIAPSFAGSVGWAVKSPSNYPKPGLLAVTSDAGRSWRRVPSPCERGHQAVGISATSIREAWTFCASEGATYMMGKSVFATTEGGTSWHLRALAPLSPFERDPLPRDGLSNGGHAAGIFFEPSGAGWLWGARGYFQLTRDGGWTWEGGGRRAVEPDVQEIMDLWFVSPEIGFALISTGRLMTTSSGGRAWRGVTTFP